MLSGDVLVIGNGLAGAVAALEAKRAGAQVVLVAHGEAASAWAQGGIVFRGEGDPLSLKKDVLLAGANRNYVPAVDLVLREGPRLIEEFFRSELGIPFDADLALEAAHSTPRILHARDQTGRVIMHAVHECLNREGIPCVDGALVDLLLSHVHGEDPIYRYARSRVFGAYFFDDRTSKVFAVTAKRVVLASGGFSGLFAHATGPASSCGDGIAAAHRVGARTCDLEFVQFHPTALYVPGKAPRLLTEALRGAGARLLTFDGRRFVDELAARDVVSRAIHHEMVTHHTPHVWLDLRPIKNDLASKFPEVVKALQSEGFNPAEDLVPVVPAAHYTLGGVWTDLDGRSSAPGLFAAGEVACTGLHGANRLASMSLLEALVMGSRAGRAAAAEALVDGEELCSPRGWTYENTPVDPALVAQDWSHLRAILWNYVGLVRSEKRLRRAEQALSQLRNEVESFYRRADLSTELLRLRHGALVGTLLLYAAIKNRHSLGTHHII